MYFNRKPQRGYNVYIDADKDDLGTQMDVGLLVMEPGDVYLIEESEKETAVLLFEGRVTLKWAEQAVEADRPDTFHREGYCLLCPRGIAIRIEARAFRAVRSANEKRARL